MPSRSPGLAESVPGHAESGESYSAVPAAPRVARCLAAAGGIEIRVGAGSRGWRLAPCRRLEGKAPVKWLKGIAVALVVIFALFYMISRPEDAANVVQGAFGAVVSATEAVGRFFSSLAS